MFVYILYIIVDEQEIHGFAAKWTKSALRIHMLFFFRSLKFMAKCGRTHEKFVGPFISYLID